MFKNIFLKVIPLFILVTSGAKDTSPFVCTMLYNKYKIAPEVRTVNGWNRYLNKELYKIEHHIYFYEIMKYDIEDIDELKKCLTKNNSISITEGL